MKTTLNKIRTKKPCADGELTAARDAVGAATWGAARDAVWADAKKKAAAISKRK